MPGVIWNTIFTPSTVSVSPVRVMVSVGIRRPGMPVEPVCPKPALTPPVALRGSSEPPMYTARRPMALPAITFSDTASSTKCSGAMIFTLPALTSASSTMPRTPP